MTSLSKKVLGSLSALALAVVTTVQPVAAAPSISGFVDFGYNYNFNGMRANALRTFDNEANSFTLQNAEVVFEGKEKEVSYRLDLNYGKDASVYNYADLNTGNNVDFEQAYLSAACPLTGGTFTVGKFVTPFGAEVIEAKDDFNISRGHLFNFAIPLHHTGVKYDKSFGDLGLTAGVVNGWDNVSDATATNGNSGKTLIFQAVKPLGEKLKVVLGGAYGPEQGQTPTNTINGNGRSLVDAVVTFTGVDKLTLVANWDWGIEEGIADADGGTQNWAGLAVHANYMLNDAWSLAARWETFDDEGSRTTTEQVLNSSTVTLQHKMNDVIARLEWRRDASSDMVYVDDKGAADDAQTTVGLQWIYAF